MLLRVRRGFTKLVTNETSATYRRIMELLLFLPIAIGTPARSVMLFGVSKMVMLFGKLIIVPNARRMAAILVFSPKDPT